jgi:hypothetical protein
MKDIKVRWEWRLELAERAKALWGNYTAVITYALPPLTAYLTCGEYFKQLLVVIAMRYLTQITLLIFFQSSSLPSVVGLTTPCRGSIREVNFWVNIPHPILKIR